MVKGKLTPIFTPNTLEFMIEYTLISSILNKICRNPSLGLATKAKACKVASQEGSPGVTVHAPGSVGKCEGMNPHTPK